MGDDGRRPVEDLISGLPDELLHAILARLRSARAAARTSVLSRRWRHVWAHNPELVLDGELEALPPPPPAAAVATLLDTVDSALAGCLAPALERLRISLPANRDLVTAGRVAPWLRFALERVAGELRLIVPWLLPDGEEAEIEIAARGGAKTIKLSIPTAWWLRFHPEGLFTSLTELAIYNCRMKDSELTTLLCTQCPRLTNLVLTVTLLADANVSIRSDSLQSLQFYVNAQRLEVVAPRLEELALSDCMQAHISAPKLAKLIWHDYGYVRCYHHFADVGRSLQLLDISTTSLPSLIRHFDEVDVFKLQFGIQQGIVGYQSFLNDTKKLPKCKTLNISLLLNYHGLAPAMLHLLRNCSNTRKFSLMLFFSNITQWYSCPSSCLCCLEESRRIDDIDLGSLHEVEINTAKISHAELEFVELLSRCNAASLKKLVINYNMSDTPPETEVCEKVRSTCRPNLKIEFYVFPDGRHGRRVLFN